MDIIIDGQTVTIDEQDAHLLSGRTWRVVKGKQNKKSYVKWSTHKKGKCVHLTLHRVILNAPAGVLVDHKDGNGLNCSRSNLRLGDALLNARNVRKRSGDRYTSRFKGVNWHKHSNKWHCKIRHSGKQHHLGSYTSEIAAAYAYDLANIQFHGAEGWRNFLPLVI